MVVLELALTLVLLVGAGLMVRSFLKLYNARLRVRTDHLVAMQMRLSDAKYHDADARRAFFDRLTPRLGVDSRRPQRSPSRPSVPPFNAARRGFVRRGRSRSGAAAKRRRSAVVQVTPAFFGDAGRAARRAAATSRIATARRGLETVDHQRALRRRSTSRARIRSGSASGSSLRRRVRGQPAPPEPWRTIVGICPTLRHASFHGTECAAGRLRALSRGRARRASRCSCRSAADPGPILNAVRGEVRALDPDQPVFTARTIDQMLWQQMWPYRVFGIALLDLRRHRARDVGRRALRRDGLLRDAADPGDRRPDGARRASGGQVSWLILQARPPAAGHRPGARAVRRLRRSAACCTALLVQITPTDPLTFAAISLDARRRRHHGVPRPGAARHARRSARRAPDRVAPAACGRRFH